MSYARAAVVALVSVLIASASSAQPRLPLSRALVEAQWPASWIAAPGAPARDASVQQFRRRLSLAAVPSSLVVHVSADPRYVLHVNGVRVGRGPARGDLQHWPFETYDLAPYLHAGENLVAATVWNFGVHAPMAQVSRRTAFLLQADDPAQSGLDTGTAWQAAVENAHAANPASLDDLHARHFYYAAGPGERRDGRRFDWAWDQPSSPEARWSAATPIGRPHPATISRGPGWMLSPEGWLLVPSGLPSLDRGDDTAGRLVRTTGLERGAAVVVPPHTTATLLYDRGEIINAYPRLTVSGGRDAVVRMTYAEALYAPDGSKGRRDEIDAKTIVGMYDELVADGGRERTFEPLWFRSWRFLQVEVTSAGEPLRLERLEARRTGFPLELRARFESPDAELARIFETGWRTARLAAHETYIDAPYWEQLQYVGDSRIDALLSYALANDDRLARRAMQLFDWSRGPEGITQSRYPTAEPQFIPPYALFFVSMVHDFWMYRGDEAFVRDRLPATRTSLEWFLARQRPDGLLGHLPYWVHGDTGTVLDDTLQDEDGGSAAISLQFAGALREAAALEETLGEPWRADRYRAAADRAAAAASALWDPSRGLLADTPARHTWGTPVNVFALLHGGLAHDARATLLGHVLSIQRHPAGRSASGGPGAAWPLDEIPSASYYFRFYVARALEDAGAGDEYLPLLEPWRRMLALGLTTWAEHPEPTRSDCHAWSAHPSFDLLRIVAGIRPARPGFARVRVAPSLGPLASLSAVHPTPLGDVQVQYVREGTSLRAIVTLPMGMTGEIMWRGVTRALVAGRQQLTLP